MKRVTIYTDGSCSGNPGPGGWGVVLIYNGIEKELRGGEMHTTNNRMEMLAAIKAIESLKESCIVELYTDSSYLKNGITLWVKNWQEKNWKTANKKAVKNVDLWQELTLLTKDHKINWHWVKSHTGDKYNEMADALAVKARDEIIKENRT
ncbi:MAG: ribonuclease HI [Alphaproteobacteria bacterium]|jgi:ribonuclease HI